jgi:hypothetical protein
MCRRGTDEFEGGTTGESATNEEHGLARNMHRRRRWSSLHTYVRVGLPLPRRQAVDFHAGQIGRYIDMELTTEELLANMTSWLTTLATGRRTDSTPIPSP